MSMADNPRYGSRRGDGSEPRGGPRAGTDPLEELARLIGRDDPFADLRRDGPQSPQRSEPPMRPEVTARPEPTAAPQREEAAAPNWPGRERGGPRRDVADEPMVRRNDPGDWRAGRYRDQVGREEPAEPEHFAEPERYAEDPGDPRYGYDRSSGYPEGSYETPYDAALPVARDYDTDGDYADEQMSDGDEAYEPQERQNGSRKTVLAVIGIIALLVGGAFAYRALTTPRDPSQTPVIVADRSPSKIVPVGQTADGQSNKLIYDRVADKPQDSGDLVSREERPVDVRNATPRVVFPGAGTGTGANQQPRDQMLGASGPAPSAAATGAANEPKKVKTLTIKPDQVGATDTADASSAWPAAPSAHSAASTPPPAPVSTRSTQRQAAVTPETTESTAPPPRAAASRAPEAGGYLVQLFSGKSETEAQDQFRALQGKYQNLLGGRQPIIRRADLGDKGVFYRAQVGPFATNELANQFCENLKTAGGKCIVQRN